VFQTKRRVVNLRRDLAHMQVDNHQLRGEASGYRRVMLQQLTGGQRGASASGSSHRRSSSDGDNFVTADGGTATPVRRVHFESTNNGPRSQVSSPSNISPIAASGGPPLPPRKTSVQVVNETGARSKVRPSDSLLRRSMTGFAGMFRAGKQMREEIELPTCSNEG
jgi:hypothetical protein